MPVSIVLRKNINIPLIGDGWDLINQYHRRYKYNGVMEQITNYKHNVFMKMFAKMP